MSLHYAYSNTRLNKELAYSFPGDLVHAQGDWYAAYGQLVVRPSRSTAAQTAVLCRHLIRLSVRISTPALGHTGGAGAGGTDGAARAGPRPAPRPTMSVA